LFRRERDGSLSLRSLVKAKARGQMDSPWKLTQQMSSEKPVDKSKRMWSWEKNNTSVKSYHQTLGIKGRTPNITTLVCNFSLPFLLFFSNSLTNANLGSI